MIEDLRVLRQAYEALHPGLYRYATPEQVDSAFQTREAEWREGASLDEAFVGLSRLLATLQCGHSYCNFFNQSEEIKAALFKGENRLPFEFRWLGERMIVKRALLADVALKPGDEILEINGEPAARILERLLPIARADGGNDFKRRAYLEVRGDSEYEAFDIFAPMLVPNWRAPFELVVRTPGEVAARTMRVAGMSDADRVAAVAEAREAMRRGEPVWRFSRTAEAAILTMPGWAMFNTKWDWTSWVNARMDELIDSNTPSLIVDLRGNEGGLDCGDAIISRLIDKDLTLSGVRRFGCYLKTPEALNAMLDTWDDQFRDVSGLVVEAEAPALLAGGGRRYYKPADEPAEGGARTIPARSPRFTGRVVVLVDSVCSSATFGFASVVRRAGLATIVGEPTGGNQRGINGGAFFFLRLPNSGIEVDVPLIASVPASAEVPDAGLTPDVVVMMTPEDLAQGIDRPMQAAMAIARGQAPGASTR